VAGKRAYPQLVRPPVVTLRPTTPKPNKSPTQVRGGWARGLGFLGFFR
jgi:hypothetical protein